MNPPPSKTIVYIDGFNLYFGVLKGFSKAKWLNIQSFMSSLRPDEEIVTIHYFTAIVHPRKPQSSERDRQKRYIQALQTCSNITVTYGKYQDREVTCRAECKEAYQVPEEKQTDVGIAVQMISDAVDGNMNRIVLVSGDSDLEPAIKWIRKRHKNIKITVYVPQQEDGGNQRRNDSYSSMNVDAKTLPCGTLLRHQFPKQITLPNNRRLKRPEEWS